MSSEKVVHLTDGNFADTVNSGYALVDFWAEWCGPCLALAPTIDDLAESYEGKVKVCKLNVDNNQEIPAQFGIRGIPTVIMFKDGEQVEMFTGNNPVKIREMVNRAVAN